VRHGIPPRGAGQRRHSAARPGPVFRRWIPQHKGRAILTLAGVVGNGPGKMFLLVMVECGDYSQLLDYEM